MVFYLYDDFETEYHDLSSTVCECKPSIHKISNGIVLIVHRKVSEDGIEAEWTKEEIERARRDILDNSL
jgi:hypothetical protein